MDSSKPVCRDQESKLSQASQLSTSPKSQHEQRDLHFGLHPKDFQIIDQKYELLKVLGAGAYGTVIQARCRRTEDIVAVKVMENVFCNFKHAKSIVREIQLLKRFTEMAAELQIDLPIVKLLDIQLGYKFKGGDDLENATIFLIIEHAETSLDNELLAREWTEDEITKVIYGIMAALRFVHSAGVMHRDIKPQNILLTNDLSVKLCDFGLARQVTEEPRDFNEVPRKDIAKVLKEEKPKRKQAARKLTQHVVTRHYRPPEVILLEKEYGPAIDVWSAGCILFELLANSEPYKGRNNQRHLFRGSCCYPLSPSKKEDDAKDVLLSILDILGRQDNLDRSFLSNIQATTYLAQCQSEMSKVDFHQELPHSSYVLTKMLSKMLKFNPYFRYTSARMVNCSHFDSVRRPEWEVSAPYKIDLEVDQPGVFDYEIYKSKLLDCSDLYNIIIQES